MRSFLGFSVLALLAGSCESPRTSGPRSERFVGCVRQLDANAGGSFLQVILNASPQGSQLVVQVDDPSLQALVLTAFVWGKSVSVTYEGQSPSKALSLEFDRSRSTDCGLTPQQPPGDDSYCVTRFEANLPGKLFKAILSDSKGTRTDVEAHDAMLQALLETAFIWNKKTYVSFDARKVVTRVKLDKFFTADCPSDPPPDHRP